MWLESKETFIMLIVGVLMMNFSTAMAFATSGGKSRSFLDSSQKSDRNEVSKQICETHACIRAAAQILDNMDPNVQPCDDFYRFACGRYISDIVIPDDKSGVNIYDKNNDKLEGQLRKSMESQMGSEDPRVFKLMQSYYNTCMDTAQIEKTSEIEFREILKELGGWPVVDGDSWVESSFDWIEFMFKLRKMGYQYDFFFDFRVTVDSKNNSRHIVAVDQASLPISREYLLKGLNEKVVKAYYDYLVDLAELFGADREQAKVELLQIVDFGIELAKLSVPREERRNSSKLYNVMTISELETRYPAIPWTDYINELMAPHATVRHDEKVVVAVPIFLEKLCILISKTPKRLLANYVMSDIVTSTIPRLGERFQIARFKYISVRSGVKSRSPRWKKCLSTVSGDFYAVLDALYVRRHFDVSAKAKTREMIDDIRDSFRQMLIQVDWMDEKTRKAALEKLDKIVSHVGYPDEYMDNEKLDEYFKHVKVYPESFLKSRLSMNLFWSAKHYDLLRKPVNKTDWINHGSSAIVNAFAYWSENSIDFPAGILQGEFFSKDRPAYLNYGAIGSVMGHEITHGFDDQGRQYNKNGNLVDWWDPQTKSKFLERAGCIIDQYSNYTVQEVGLNLNGKTTQGENIADIGGLKEAYFAYNAWEKRNGQEARLPGLPYTSQQMFWISNANTECGKKRPENLKSLVLTGVHSPHEFRVNGPVSSLHEFSEDFKCPLGSAMNPVKKCTVW